MGSKVNDMMNQWGKGHAEQLGPEEALAWCRKLTLGHYENFSVLSRFVPDRMRDGISTVYAFSRWADDLADESASPDEALDHLAWWRSELDDCFGGRARHPIFVALSTVLERHQLDRVLFDRLIDAFEQDQHQNRYATWSDVVAYSSSSADPVGRLVLQLSGEAMTEAQLAASDSVCTGLQLANHWQDVQRDVLEQNRIYIPTDMAPVQDFNERLIVTARQGFAPDHDFLASYRNVIHALTERTRPMLLKMETLIDSVSSDIRPMLWLFSAGGLSVLDAIERSDCETVLYRVSVSKPHKLWLLWRAYRKGRAT
jgi:squalene synthase HpnC